MNNLKNTITAFQEQITNHLRSQSGSLRSRIDDVKEMLSSKIKEAKVLNDGLTQLYCCMAEAHLAAFVGDKNELIQTLEEITKTNTRFILSHEKDVTYPKDTTLLHADLYGLYYVLNDHYSKLWDDEYALSKNGDVGNPLITNLIKLCIENDRGEPIYRLLDNTDVELDEGKKAHNKIRENLFNIFDKYNTKIFSDTSIAFVGGGGSVYTKVVLGLGLQFGVKNFLNFSPYMNTPGLDMDSATFVTEEMDTCVDYVVTSNVLNAFSHHIDHNSRDEVFSCSAKILKQGGKAIHLIEKNSEQAHFNVNLNKSLHTSVGQQLVYSFYREKSKFDLLTDRSMKNQKIDFPMMEVITLGGDEDDILNSMLNDMFFDHMHHERQARMKRLQETSLDGKKDDFRTSMLVMLQKEKPVITKTSINETKLKMNNFVHRFNYYQKPVYAEKPGVEM